jgi:hypothetical protein
MSRAKTPRSPRFDQVVISVFFACFASWRENGMCETNPICHPGQAGGVPAGAKHAKQTQFGPAWAGPSPGWTKDAKQSQTWVDWGIWGMARAEPVVRNKANYQRSSRSDGCGTDNREPSAAIRHRMPATPASRMTTGIGFTGRAGRVTLSVKSIVGCES